VQVPAPDVMLDRIRALPGAAPVLDAIAGTPGVYLVGGAVRDLLLGIASPDLDLAVEGESGAVLAAIGGETRVHDRFGTGTATRDGHTYDVARARTERYAAPGALPDVEPASIAEDLKRRDFTVNALAVPLTGPHAGELLSAPDALADLEAGRLRVLNEGSFIDDPTRLMRLVRYGSRLRFAREARTDALASAAIAGGALGTLTGSRLGAELRLLAREHDPVAAVAGLSALGIDEAIEPGFGLHDGGDRARRALQLLPADGRADLLVLAAAARDVPAERIGPLLERLAFEAVDRDTILAAASGADALAGVLANASRPSEVAAAAAGAEPELVALAGALGGEATAREWLDRLRHVPLEISGADLIAAGVPEGPAIGQGLRGALAAKLDGEADGREAELAAALAAARDAG
jgi:tRNA nucleotidyltransferase (CCA-adding enzyme)